MARRAYMNLTASGTTTVKSGQGELAGMIVNTSAAGATVTLYDSTTASGTKIATVNTPNNFVANIIYGLMFTNGLTVNLSAACDVTIIYT